MHFSTEKPIVFDSRQPKPNDATHKAFGDALRDAVKAGVRVMAVDCIITPDEMKTDSMIDIEL